ncbi:MAG: hypothetical protein Q7O66_07245 [Dehalococcoidia bacterium]|nr:hypothetical protein [Dehalococcoidia bacterium]
MNRRQYEFDRWEQKLARYRRMMRYDKANAYPLDMRRATGELYGGLRREIAAMGKGLLPFRTVT